MNNEDLPKNVRAVVFDVDGTLYCQKRMRIFMLCELLLDLIKPPFKFETLKAIKKFREHREGISSKKKTTLEEQYAEVALLCGISPERMRGLVNDWLFIKPLKYLKFCKYKGLDGLFSSLAQNGITLGIYSEYPSEEKIKSLGLYANVFVCSTDPDVGYLKPNPRGLLVCCEKLNVRPEDTLFVGDRLDKDGLCAKNLGVGYVNVPTFKSNRFYDQFFQKLTRCILGSE